MAQAEAGQERFELINIVLPFLISHQYWCQKNSVESAPNYTGGVKCPNPKVQMLKVFN